MMMFDPEEALAEVWERLHEWRDLFFEGNEDYDNKWNDVCGTMANIREAFGLPDEVDLELRGRFWISDTSHKMHGARVICFEPTGSRVVTVYFAEGPVISALVPREALSEGWPER